MQKNKYETILNSIILASLITLIISLIWYLLEIMYYNEIQHRKVDDIIISIVYLLAFTASLLYLQKQKNKSSKTDIVHYINLTNGIEAIPTLPPSIDYRFIRIQSTICEQHLWNKLLLELNDDLLMNLALGKTCIVYDYGARKPVPRSIYTGLEFIKYVLHRRWLCDEYKPIIRRNSHTKINCKHEFDHYYRNLSKNAKKKIDYYIPYLNTNDIKLYATTSSTKHDGDKAYYRSILLKESQK